MPVTYAEGTTPVDHIPCQESSCVHSFLPAVYFPKSRLPFGGSVLVSCRSPIDLSFHSLASALQSSSEVEWLQTCHPLDVLEVAKKVKQSRYE